MNIHTIISNCIRGRILFALAIIAVVIFGTSISDGQTQYGRNAIPDGLRDTYADFDTAYLEYEPALYTASTPLEYKLGAAFDNEVYIPIGTEIIYRDAEPDIPAIIGRDATNPALQTKNFQCAITANGTSNNATNGMFAANCKVE